MPTSPELRARLFAVALLLALGVWVLYSFIAQLAWAVIVAISTWPLYRRLLASQDLHGRVTWGAVALTSLIGLLFLAPIGYGLMRLLEEAQLLAQYLLEAQKSGIPAPVWLKSLPVAGEWAGDKWQEAFGTGQATYQTLKLLGTGQVIAYTRDFAGQLLHRLVSFMVFLLILLFVYQYGDRLARQIKASSRKLFGEVGVRYVADATVAVRGTVNGMMLVGLGKGLLMGVGYAAVGLGSPAILGALTGIFAMVPFAAKLIFSACSLVLLAQNQIPEAAGLFVYGMALTFVADNYLRPLLIGGAVRLHFLWSLLGIFGGMEAMGFLGLFMGPALLAVLMSIWRDWLADLDEPSAG